MEKEFNDKLLLIDGTKFLGVREVTIVDDVKVGAVTLNSPEHLITRLVVGSQNTSQNDLVTDQHDCDNIYRHTLNETSVSSSNTSWESIMSDVGESTDGTVPPLIYFDDSSSDESEDEHSEVRGYEDDKFWATNNELNDSEKPFERLFVNAEEIGQELSVPEIAELLRDPDIWIADTGASNHLTWSNHGAKSVR